MSSDCRWQASIVESSDDAIVSKNLDGVITSWNRGAERVFGYTAAEAVGQPITIVIPQDRQDEERTILTRIRRGKRVDRFETVRRRQHGSLIVVSLTISPVRNAEGKVVGASKIARDITEQKRSQEQIATLAREAEHRSKNLLANVQAIVNLSQASDLDDLKRVIEGRIKALANVHSLFVEARWIGAELSAVATQELAPYFATGNARWAADNVSVIKELKPPQPPGFNNRLSANWKLPLQIAQHARGGWPEQARRAAIYLSRTPYEPSMGVQLLAALQAMFAKNRTQITSEQVVQELLADPDSQWHEYRSRGPITKNLVAALLKDFEIRPVVVHPTKRADLSRHGYRAVQFEDAFARFLPPEPNIRTLKRGGCEKT